MRERLCRGHFVKSRQSSIIIFLEWVRELLQRDCWDWLTILLADVWRQWKMLWEFHVTLITVQPACTVECWPPFCLYVHTVSADICICVSAWVYELTCAGGVSVHVDGVEHPLSELLELGSRGLGLLLQSLVVLPQPFNLSLKPQLLFTLLQQMEKCCIKLFNLTCYQAVNSGGEKWWNGS